MALWCHFSPHPPRYLLPFLATSIAVVFLQNRKSVAPGALPTQAAINGGAYIPAGWVYLLKAASNKQKRISCSSWHRQPLTEPPVQTNTNARNPPAGEQVLHNAKNQPPFVAISGNKRRRSGSKGTRKCPLIYFFLIRRVQKQSRLSLGKSFPLPDRRQGLVGSKAGPCEIPKARPWVPTKPLAAPRGSQSH